MSSFVAYLSGLYASLMWSIQHHGPGFHKLYILLRIAKDMLSNDHGREDDRRGDSDRPLIPLDLSQG